MENSSYLPVGSKIGGHYEIIQILGEDNFEIIYVVKDIHRLETLFVLKELFLKGFSLRDDREVYTLVKSKDMFEKKKKDTVREVGVLKKNNSSNRLQIYGYFEENNTVYTIMEFANDAKLDSYLQVEPKILSQPKPRPTPAPKPKEGKKSTKPKKSFLFLKMLIGAIVVFAVLGVYAYNMIEEDKERSHVRPVAEVAKKEIVKKTTIHHPPLVDRTNESTDTSTPTVVKETVVEDKEVKQEVVEEKSPKMEEPNLPNEDITIEEIKPKEQEVFVSLPEDEVETKEESAPIETEVFNDFSKDKIKKDKIETQTEETLSRGERPSLEIPESATPQSSRVSLGRRIGGSSESSRGSSSLQFNKNNIQVFLDKFLLSSSGDSINSILSLYDSHVDRYFSLSSVDHSKIKKDKTNYHRKWVKRNFQLLDFKILKIYQRGGIDYCDLETTTEWRVSNRYQRTISGKSRGFMTLKRTASGFKVKSIYTLK